MDEYRRIKVYLYELIKCLYVNMYAVIIIQLVELFQCMNQSGWT